MEEYITKKTQELRLVNFKLITYANLKKYEFQYKLLQPIYKIEPLAVDFVKPLTEVFKEKDQVTAFLFDNFTYFFFRILVSSDMLPQEFTGGIGAGALRAPPSRRCWGSQPD